MAKALSDCVETLRTGTEVQQVRPYKCWIHGSTTSNINIGRCSVSTALGTTTYGFRDPSLELAATGKFA